MAPTRVDLPPDDATGVVTLQNNAAEPVMVQVQTFAWPRSPASADLEPTRDLLAVPPVFELAGNARQIIRVALRGALSGEREHAYRLLITEVPRGATASAGVRFALRLSLPVFVTPPGAEPQAGLVGPPGGRGQRTRAAQRGHRAPAGAPHHVALRWRELARRAPSTLRPTCSPARSMAGRCPASPARPILQLEAETSIGPLSATVAPPRG